MDYYVKLNLIDYLTNVVVLVDQIHHLLIVDHLKIKFYLNKKYDEQIILSDGFLGNLFIPDC
jgi:hypothetical protein